MLLFLKVIKRKSDFILLLILLLATFLRLYDIQSNPKAMYGDELTLIYDAYSISQTGYDQKGERLPLVFNLGAARPPAYVYLSVPFAALFGPTAFAARSISVFSGIGIVFFIYLLTKRLFNKQVALYASLFAAISPWGIALSRGGFETNLALFLSTIGVYGLFRSKSGPIWLIISAACFALSLQSYSTYRMTIPLFLISIAVLNFNRTKEFIQKHKIISFISVSIVLFSIFLSLYLTFSIGSRDRFSTINILLDPEVQSVLSQKVVLERNETGFPRLIAFIFHNKYLETVDLFLKNYLSNFSLEFLFLNGDGNPRHNPAEMGQFYLVILIPILFALGNLYKLNLNRLMFLSTWILITPLASSIVGAAHALRSSFMLPPLIILAAFGMEGILNSRNILLIKGKYILVAIFLFILGQFVFLVERIYVVAPGLNAEFWSYSAKQAAEIAYENKNKFDYIVLSNNIPNMEYAYPTYNRVDPKLVIQQNQHKTVLGEYKFFNYDNIYISSLPRGDIVNFVNSLPGSVLYIGQKEEGSGGQLATVAKSIRQFPQLIIIEKTSGL